MFEAKAAAHAQGRPAEAGKENGLHANRAGTGHPGGGGGATVWHSNCAVQLGLLPGLGVRFATASQEGAVAEWRLL
jgi:hypothetical protein